MTSFHLAENVLLTLQAGAWLAVGTLVGAFHFLTLQLNVGMLVSCRVRPLAIAVQLGRYALVAGVLAVVASCFGVFALLLASAGILTARLAILR